MKFGNNYWESYSPKLGRIVRFFSDLEYDNWVYIETNPNIISFCEQPLKINVEIDGIIKTSIFDMWILYKDNTEEFIEVKYNKELIGNSKKAIHSQKQIEAQKRWCYENNYNYSVKTDLEIRKNLTYLNSLKHIISVVKRCKNIDEFYYRQILNLVKDNPLSILEINNKIQLENNFTMQIICYLIYTGLIKITNPDIYFSFDTKVVYYV